MALYYEGDLDADLAALEASKDGDFAKDLDKIGFLIGYGRSQQILQLLWARHLREKGLPPSGALFR